LPGCKMVASRMTTDHDDMAQLAMAPLLALALAAFVGPAHATATPFAVAAYLPEWRYEGANWEVISAHTSHLIIFSLEVARVPAGGAGSLIGALDRIPRPELLEQARAAADRHGTKLLICFGGNGRSDGFSPMVRSAALRRRFVAELVALCDEYGFDGVDYNWEYPGYAFGTGYKAQPEVDADYAGLRGLLEDTHAAFEGSGRAITMAYYPDGRQESLFAAGGYAQWVDLMHMMAYDQSGEHHSTLEFGRKVAAQGAKLLPAPQVTLGLPFYGRDSATGDWVTYEDIVQQYPIKPSTDSVTKKGTGGKVSLGFNGVQTIRAKVRYAIELGLGGVMIWEVGQDCRLEPVTHGTETHVRTCPPKEDGGDNRSLLVAITREMAKGGVVLPAAAAAAGAAEAGAAAAAAADEQAPDTGAAATKTEL
jgi:chitinase